MWWAKTSSKHKFLEKTITKEMLNIKMKNYNTINFFYYSIRYNCQAIYQISKLQFKIFLTVNTQTSTIITMTECRSNVCVDTIVVPQYWSSKGKIEYKSWFNVQCCSRISILIVIQCITISILILLDDLITDIIYQAIPR